MAVQVPRISKDVNSHKAAHSVYGAGNVIENKAENEDTEGEEDLGQLAATWANAGTQQFSQMTVKVNAVSMHSQLLMYSLIPNWWNHLDFNFQRKPGFNDDTPIRRFNDCHYVQEHLSYDRYNRVRLSNNRVIRRGDVINPNIVAWANQRWYVYDVQYRLPRNVAQCTSKEEFAREMGNVQEQSQWRPAIFVRVMLIVLPRGVAGRWYILDDTIRDIVLTEALVHALTVEHQPPPIYAHSTGDEIWRPKYRYPLRRKAVATNKPFLFFYAGHDKYAHTQTQGKFNDDTHGSYFWIANMNAELNETSLYTMILSQSTSRASMQAVTIVGNAQMMALIRNGLITFKNGKLTKIGCELAFQVSDMQDRVILLRARGVAVQSYADGQLYLGHAHGNRWPPNAENLMEWTVFLPGRVRLLWYNFIFKKMADAGAWPKLNIPEWYDGKAIALTKCKFDIYHGSPIASSIKSPIELQHTTVLGCINQLFLCEWSHLHSKHLLNYDETHTRAMLACCADLLVDGINGWKSYLANIKESVRQMNQMHKSWMIYMEIFLCLKSVVYIHSNRLNILNSLIQLTGALMGCDTINKRIRLQRIARNVFDTS